MIGKITKGKAFAPLVKYVLNPDKKARVVATNMCGETPLQLIAELQITEDLNLRVQSPVCHISLSFPVGETVSDETLKEIAGDYLPQMGFDDNPYFVAVHEDTDHFHAHIVTSRIKWSGKCVPDWKDYQQSETILRSLEQKYQLTPVTPSWEVTRAADTTGEIRRQRKQQEQSKSVRRQLQDEIDKITKNRAVSVTELFKKLESAGIEVEVTQTPNGLGISFSLDEVSISGTNLGAAYTWNGLQKHKSVSYDPQGDKQAVEQAIVSRQYRLSNGEGSETETITRNVTGNLNEKTNKSKMSSRENLFTVGEKTANQDDPYADQETELKQFPRETQRTESSFLRAINQRLAELINLVGNVSQTEQRDSVRTNESESENHTLGANQQGNLESTEGVKRVNFREQSRRRGTRTNRVNQGDTEAGTKLDGGTSTEHRTVNLGDESEFERLAELQTAARRSIEELEAEYKERHPDGDGKRQSEHQQPSRRSEQSQPETQPSYQPSQPKTQPSYQPSPPKKSRGFSR
ncbi:relaxase/mobilization nuclease domain-containing protein [Gloeothece verrucosa]|uniref:Relaxase/mobilization nuclease family protein n=1 Tax=Gloeothece verrucosa (strain PCC 7822) TaxID=497965 RepID=E0UNV3_GLOV7|nr:relaxase/mobilization nuclease domain-containing protein [Gloeothece verrucosa]ADN18633.1 Relaxase/mobilization nuclease family protein [Gloeothece verrucosa PCC 7822]